MLSLKRLQTNGINALRRIEFVKYHGAGNDFILVDNRDKRYDFINADWIKLLCDRRFGVGADGFIAINGSVLDFEADYSNSDGSKSFCGNGARCAVAFANEIGIHRSAYRFDAIDGVHQAAFQEDLVALEMLPVSEVQIVQHDFILHTGSPHYIRFVSDLDQLDVFESGRAIRYSDTFKEQGINVNFIEEIPNGIAIRTYERGVEDETLACGTGITAAALAYAIKNDLFGKQRIAVKALGGNLTVSFNRLGEQQFEEIVLIGPAQRVFKGVFEGEL